MTPPLRARLAAAAPALDDATLDAIERAALPLVWRDGMAYLGQIHVGAVYRAMARHDWLCIPRGIPNIPASAHPTEAAARAALETAVMEAIYADNS